MNKICIFFCTIICFLVTEVNAQDDRDPNEPYLIDEFNYITRSGESIVALRNIVKGTDFEGSSTIYNGEAVAKSVYKIDGGLYFNPTRFNTAILTSQDVEFQGTGNDIDKYYWRFRFAVKGRGGIQSTPNIKVKYSDNTEETFVFEVPSGSTYTEHDLEFQLGSKNIIQFEIRALAGFNGFDVDKIAIYTDAPMSNTTTFNGTAWSRGVPNINTDAIFKGNFIYNEPLKAKNLKVLEGSNIIIKSGNNITLSSSLNVDNGAVLKFQENAYLIQYNPEVNNTGNAIFVRSTKPMYRYNTNTWSSPVAKQKLFTFSPNTLTTTFFNYITNTDSWSNSGINSSSTFTPGIGYGIYAPNNFPNYNNGNNQPAIFTGEFVGVPNNGDIEVAINIESTGKRQYLLGNPYPSPISLMALIDRYYEEIDVVSLYTHEVPVNNLTGQYASEKTHFLTINNSGESDPDLGLSSYMIDVGQAFFIKINEAQNRNFKLLFTNYYLRFDDEGFFDHNETPISYRNNRRVDDKFWLTLRKDSEKLGSNLIGFSSNSTDEFDPKYDAKGIDASGKIGVFSQMNSENYIIQSYSNFSQDKKVLLSFRTPEIGVYNIDLAKVKGVFENQKIYLKDNLLNNLIDLSELETYQFSAEKGLNKDRFEIYFKENLSINDLKQDNVNIYVKESDLIIQVENEGISNYKIYDITGKLILYGDFIKNTTVSNLDKGVYVAVVSNNGNINNKRIIIK